MEAILDEMVCVYEYTVELKYNAAMSKACNLIMKNRKDVNKLCCKGSSGRWQANLKKVLQKFQYNKLMIRLIFWE